MILKKVKVKHLWKQNLVIIDFTYNNLQLILCKEYSMDFEKVLEVCKLHLTVTFML